MTPVIDHVVYVLLAVWLMGLIAAVSLTAGVYSFVKIKLYAVESNAERLFGWADAIGGAVMGLVFAVLANATIALLDPGFGVMSWGVMLFFSILFYIRSTLGGAGFDEHREQYVYGVEWPPVKGGDDDVE